MTEQANIYLYGEIGLDVDADYIRTAIADASGGIDLRINSGGGEVFEGQAIYSLLNQYKTNSGETVRVFIDSLAASIASVIAMAGDEILMAENALFMVHNPWTWGGGTAKELRETANVLDKVRDTLITVYDRRTGLGRDKIGAMMDAETWFDASEAVDMGFADTIVTPSSVPAASIRAFAYKHAPPSVRDKQQPLDRLQEKRNAPHRRNLAALHLRRLKSD